MKDNNHLDIQQDPILQRLENQGRLRELRINELLSNTSEIKEGMTCVDMGAGTGIFSFKLTDRVGENGIVYAVDKNDEMLGYIRRKNPSKNMQLVNRNSEDTGLKSGIADCCLLAFILHEVDMPNEVIDEAYRLLKRDGKVMVVEWKGGPTPKGPSQKMRITNDKLKQLLEQAGFVNLRYLNWSVNHYVALGDKKE
ncbi:class I SAM-dependent methyltransferase [Chloroflexota bacterium]